MKTSRCNLRCVPAAQRPGRRAYTVFELLISISLIGILLGILLLGIRKISAAARDAQQRGTVMAFRQAMSEFEKEFGGGLPFPVVAAKRPWAFDPNALPVFFIDDAGRKALRVYVPTDPVLRKPTLDSGDPVPADNPFLDYRFSTWAPAYFLAGVLEEPSVDLQPTSPPFDGVRGAGTLAVVNEGGAARFDLPKQAGNWDSVARRYARPGRIYTPYVDLGRSDPVVYQDTTQAARVELRDRKGAAYRYYRWSVGPANSPNVTEPASFAELNVPKLIGRDPGDAALDAIVKSRLLDGSPRNVRTNPSLQKARWAIVAAGPNGVFGDEDISEIARKMGLTDPSTMAGADRQAESVKLRLKAEEDNIVEVGP